MNSNQTPEPIEVDWGTPDLDNTVRLVTEAVDEIRTSLGEVFAPVITALAAVDTEAVHAIRDRLRYGDADTADVWTGPGAPPEPFTYDTVTCPGCGHGIDPHGTRPGGQCGVGGCTCLWSPNCIAAHLLATAASQPQSTETREQSTPDGQDATITVDVAEAWLIADHDERVTTGIVRPATERALELITQLRGPIIADAAWDLRRICRRAPGHICGTGCDLDATAQLLEHLADELNRDAAPGADRD